ncbi:MAG: DciA family protein [Flavobacteriaceae bacterium]
MTPPPKFEPQSLLDVLAEIKEQKNLSKGFQQQRLEEVWKEVTGPLVSQYTTDVRWSRKKIRVQISSAPLRQELSAGLDKLQKHLQEKLPDWDIQGIVLY